MACPAAHIPPRCHEPGSRPTRRVAVAGARGAFRRIRRADILSGEIRRLVPLLVLFRQDDGGCLDALVDATAGGGDAVEVQLGSGGGGRRGVWDVDRPGRLLSPGEPAPELFGSGQGKVGGRAGRRVVEPAGPLWPGQHAGLGVYRGACTGFIAGGAAIGGSLLPLPPLSLYRESRFSVRAAGPVHVDSLPADRGGVRRRASRVAGGNSLWPGLSGAGVLEETARRRHHRPRHHQFPARGLGCLAWSVAVLVSVPCVIIEDEHLLAVNKPAGMNTHAPGPYSVEGLYEWLRHREARWARLAILHRLDKETSGVLVFSKTELANRSLTEQFTRRTVRKRYLLLTDRAVRRQDFTVQSALVRVGERYAARPAHAGGERAETRFRVLGSASGRTLLEAEPLTGKTHQIRVHAAANGFAILGDTLYGGTPAARVHLHAQGLTLKHPASRMPTTVIAPVDFTADTRLALRSALIDAGETNAY